ILILVIAVNSNGQSEDKMPDNIPCQNTTDCLNLVAKTVCVDNLCKCWPDYRWDAKTDLCESFSCNPNNDTECKRYDENRECTGDTPHSGTCRCVRYYTPDTNNGYKCTRSSKLQMSCKSSKECDPVTQRCLNNRCQCNVDYEVDTDSGKCEKISCSEAVE